MTPQMKNSSNSPERHQDQSLKNSALSNGLAGRPQLEPIMEDSIEFRAGKSPSNKNTKDRKNPFKE